MTWFIHVLRARQLRRRGHDRSEVLARAIARLSRSRAPGAHSLLWTDAIYGWGNEKWAAEEQYLAEVVRSVERTRGSILECGSGLTTLMMGAVATRTGVRLHSLEHDAEWHARVDGAIRDFGLTNATVHFAPLRDFGEYDWYDAPLPSLPDDISLVICDGPPASTRGGRSGMMPTMRDRLTPGCVILLDDLIRPAEQALVEQWMHEFGASAKRRESNRGFARVEMPGS